MRKLLQQGRQQQFLNTAQGGGGEGDCGGEVGEGGVGGSSEGKGVSRWPSELKVWTIFLKIFFFFDVDYF